MSIVILLISIGLFFTILGVIISLLNLNKHRVKKCPGCKNAIQPNTKSCPYCGYILR